MSALDGLQFVNGVDPQECISDAVNIFENHMADGCPYAVEIKEGLQAASNLTNILGIDKSKIEETIASRLREIADDKQSVRVIGLLVNVGVAAIIKERDRRAASAQVSSALDSLLASRRHGNN